MSETSENSVTKNNVVVIYETPKFRWGVFLLIAFVLPIVLILIWLLWSVLVYRYSDDRMNGLMAKKYDGPVNDDTESLNVINGHYDRTTGTVSATARVVGKNTRGQLLRESQMVLKVDPTCAVIDKTCVKL